MLSYFLDKNQGYEVKTVYLIAKKFFKDIDLYNTIDIANKKINKVIKAD